MADLPYIQEAQEVKITGQDSTGNTVNYVSADSNGNLLVLDYANGPVNPGTVAPVSNLIGGQYNSTLPTLTTGQQSAIQIDNKGRILLSDLPSSASKFSFGEISTSATTQVPVEATVYTETTTNSTMTLVSSSANDSSAGTGARTVTVTYLDQTGAGPNTTTFTLNGTTAVTASVSNMCFIEKIIVETVGSTESNVGILTLKTGGGTTVGTVAATINQTLWAHHYIPLDKVCYVSGFSYGNNATAPGNGATFVLKYATPTVTNSTLIQVSDFISAAGAASSGVRIYGSPIQLLGPGKVIAYVTPFANAATIQYAAFDFIDD